MTWSVALLLAMSPVTPATSIQAQMSDELAVAQRFIAAIENKRTYEDSDFIKPPGLRDKAFLSAYSTCKVTHVGHTLMGHPKKSSVLVRMPGTVAVQWRCKGVPPDFPTHITLIFKDGKIGRIETHRED